MTTYNTPAILAALDRWIRQRPGLDFRNYGDVRAYRAELRSIARDLRDARTLLTRVKWMDPDSINWSEAFRAYSGRLSWDGSKLDYCTGQYWPTEYRKAACAVLSSIIWDQYRDTAPDPVDDNDTVSRGDYIRHSARREFGRSLARRWFDA